MHVLVAGAGIAGLGAAWELRRAGHDVTVLEEAATPGGRCRSFRWHGRWFNTGAFAFITKEENTIALARQLGIYEDSQITDVTSAHEEHLLYRRKKVLKLRAFSIAEILKMRGIPAREKLALARVLPALVRQRFRNDPRDITSAVALDGVSACDYFREHSPTFVDYILEPTMQMFCGYGEEDYSLAWLAWLMGGIEWAHSWWTFRDEGVGRLTRVLAERLVQAGCDLRTGAAALELAFAGGGVEAAVACDGRQETLRADALVVAVPGDRVAALMPGLDPERRAFFERVSYVAHHIVRYIVEEPSASGLQTPPGAFAVGLILPTVDGFARVSNLHFERMVDGRLLAGGELKGRYCAARQDADDATILGEAWEEFVAAVPEAAGCRVVDAHLQRNPSAICRREPGYIRRLAAFRALDPLPRVEFAGDYLLNSTVGQAHYTGLQAAARLAARQ